MVYNLSNITGASNILQVTQGLNSVSGGLFWSLLMFTLFVIILIANSDRYDIRKVLVVDSLFIALIGFLGLALNFIAFWIVLIPVLIFAGALISLLTAR